MNNQTKHSLKRAQRKKEATCNGGSVQARYIVCPFLDSLNFATKAAQFFVVLRKAIGMGGSYDTLLNRGAATSHWAQNI